MTNVISNGINPVCHSERSEDSTNILWRCFAALNMTNAMREGLQWKTRSEARI